jgi:hypothetical protein
LENNLIERRTATKTFIPNKIDGTWKHDGRKRRASQKQERDERI